METSSPVNPSPVASSPRRVWIYLIVLVVLASLILVAWQSGFLVKDSSDELSQEEIDQINAFLNSNDIPAPTEEQVVGIKAYLNQAEPAPTPEEEAKILEYLNQ